MWRGWTTTWTTRRLLRAWRRTRQAAQAASAQQAALTQVLNRLGVLYALDLQSRGVPTGTLLEEFARAADYVLPEPVDPATLAADNQARAQMRDEDYADLEALEQYGWTGKTAEEQEAMLDALRAVRREEAEMPRIYARAARTPRERAHTTATMLPYTG